MIMKLTQEQEEALELGNYEPLYKNMLKELGENVLFYALREKYTSGKVAYWSIAEYVEMLKKEIRQEDIY